MTLAWDDSGADVDNRQNIRAMVSIYCMDNTALLTTSLVSCYAPWLRYCPDSRAKFSTNTTAASKRKRRVQRCAQAKRWYRQRSRLLCQQLDGAQGLESTREEFYGVSPNQSEPAEAVISKGPLIGPYAFRQRTDHP